MQGGNENENNDDVNDANVYVKNCGPVFNSFVAYLSVHSRGNTSAFLYIKILVSGQENLACKKNNKTSQSKSDRVSIGIVSIIEV